MTDTNEAAPPKKKTKWIPIVIGILFLMTVLGVSGIVFTVAWFRNNMQITETSEPEAAKAFDEVRARFPGQQPLLEFRDGRPHSVNTSTMASTTKLTTLHLLAFDDDDDELARVDIPFWLLRMKSGPIAFGSYASGFDDERIKLTVEDIERRGPGIVLDLLRQGEGRVLVWAE